MENNQYKCKFIERKYTTSGIIVVCLPAEEICPYQGYLPTSRQGCLVCKAMCNLSTAIKDAREESYKKGYHDGLNNSFEEYTKRLTNLIKDNGQS